MRQLKSARMTSSGGAGPSRWKTCSLLASWWSWIFSSVVKSRRRFRAWKAAPKRKAWGTFQRVVVGIVVGVPVSKRSTRVSPLMSIQTLERYEKPRLSQEVASHCTPSRTPGMPKPETSCSTGLYTRFCTSWIARTDSWA